MLRFWVIIAFFCTINWCASQTTINYSEKDGLPSNHVYKITQDIHGFIWIATDEGLVKFNGTDFKTFTTKDRLPTNDIYNLFPAKDGKLWYVAKSTSLGYILNDIVFDFKNVKENIGMNPFFPGFTGNDLIASSSNTSHIINNDKKWENMEYNSNEDYINQAYLIHPKYKGVVVLKNDINKLAVITNEDKFITVDDGSFNYLSHLRMQLTDSLFIAFTKHHYGFLNLNNLETKIYSYEDLLDTSTIKYCRIHLVNNSLQLSGENIVALLDQNLKVSKVINIPKKWKSHFSFIDRENNVWSASFTNGIFKYSIKEESIIKEFSDSKINDIKRVDDDIIALVSGKGFYKYNLKINRFVPHISTSHFLHDAQYLEELNCSYFITRQKIYSNNQEKKTSQTTNEVLSEISRSMDYHQDYIYSHVSGGINKIDPNNLENRKLLELNNVRCEVSFQGKLLVGVSNGLYELADEEFKIVPSLSNFKKPVIDLLPINQKSIILCTGGYGVYITDLNNIELLEGSEFLKTNHPYFEDNHLYLPSNKGIYHYEYVNDKFLLKNIWNNTNGLPTNKINGVEKLGNLLLIATNQGIIHFPLDYQPEQGLLDIYVENMVYANKNLNKGSEIKYQSKGDLQVVVKSIDFRSNSKLNYEFQLSPTQKNWTETSSANLRFSDLPPADYELTLKSEGIVNSFCFSIKPMWHQSLWFYILLLLGSITLIIFTTKTVTKNLEEKKNKDALRSQQLSDLQLKALRSQMNPHFVFNSLTAIQYYINENDFETSDIYLVKFSRLVREFFELSKEQWINIEREISLLKNYLDLEKLRFKNKLNYEIIVDPDLNLKEKLPCMLLQPIVENAVNHGVFNKDIPGKVTIRFKKLNSQHIQIYVQDDGIGYSLNKEDQRYKSSTVLEDRLRYLNDSRVWEIKIKRKSLTADDKYPGHKVIFDIKKNSNENL
ncbi:hypothetical protein A9Q93_04035 [Nonlabens dokdonensis]|uniref:Signal transduction histidine kinase internal region domain-containing protein n=1 Tax=Nonlabens dokdonensis TaxID=328515 RepID=A0A1Z8B665_9FLAO|nr:histidine kinase [Nonlabens dokdonensis]OUS18072.1 hypothetical protein A9Q93_04035 [Nonlabens dokdonensis]